MIEKSTFFTFRAESKKDFKKRHFFMANSTFLVFGILLSCSEKKVYAAFEDSGYSPRAVAMGGAMTAVTGDPVSLFYNPATLGPQRNAALSTNFLHQFHIPAGPVDQDIMNVAAVVPVSQEIINGTFGFSHVYNEQKNAAIERAGGLSYGSRSFHEFDGGVLEWGATLKWLKRTLNSGSGPALEGGLDVGMLGRFEDIYTVGFSLLNFNRPSLNAVTADRAPLTAKLGFAEQVKGFTYAFDISKREPSGGHPGSANLGAGLENWWPTANRGSVAVRTGLSLGNRDKTFNWGFGWSLFGGQLDYSMTVPVEGVARLSHGVGLLYRFGQSNPEAEYAKVLAGEMRTRQDLTRALEAGEIKQWKLAEELRLQREELAALRAQLLDKTASEAEARQRMRELEERHRQATEKFSKMQAEAKKLAEKTKDTLFQEDWAAYDKLKLGGAPDAVLMDQVKRILREYKDTGVDLSAANQELLRLLRGK